MKELAAYLLCVLGGNKEPSVDDIVRVIKAPAGGFTAEEEEAMAREAAVVVTKLHGRSLEEILAAGLPKIEALATHVGTSPASNASETAPEVESKVEEEEEEIEMPGLFDDGDDMW